MKAVDVRISETGYRQLRRVTAPSFVRGLENAPETGCVLLVTRNDHPERPSLVVEEVLEPLEGEVEESTHVGLVFSSGFLRRALLAVRRGGFAGFLTVHTHPLAKSTVGFSRYDDANDPALMANLYELQPDGVFGSLVLGERSVAGRLWGPTPGPSTPLGELVIVGERLEWLSLEGSRPPDPPEAAEIFDRGLALTGCGALARLSRMRAAIVGASGTGSVLAELLMRAGVGEIVFFEFDVVGPENLNRILHARSRDAEVQVDKAERLCEALSEAGMPTKVRRVQGGDVRVDRVAAELRGCDILYGCVDNCDWPRLVLTQVAYQYLLPYIDMGTEIGLGDDGVQSVDSRVSYCAPGRACLVCTGIVSEEQVRLEGLAPEERARVLAMGYSKERPLAAPAVMDLNVRAASYAALVTRHLLQPFLDTPLPTHVKESVTNFRTKPLRVAPNPDCYVCGVRGRVGLGDCLPLTVRRE